MASAQQPWLLFYLHPQPCQTCCLPSPGLAQRHIQLLKDCLELATHAAPDGAGNREQAMPVVWQTWKEGEPVGKGPWAVPFGVGWEKRGSFITNVLY